MGWRSATERMSQAFVTRTLHRSERRSIALSGCNSPLREPNAIRGGGRLIRRVGAQTGRKRPKKVIYSSVYDLLFTVRSLDGRLSRKISHVLL